jgi:DNA-directed RNA polymerase subunit RPC12/RpoP
LDVCCLANEVNERVLTDSDPVFNWACSSACLLFVLNRIASPAISTLNSLRLGVEISHTLPTSSQNSAALFLKEFSQFINKVGYVFYFSLKDVMNSPLFMMKSSLACELSLDLRFFDNKHSQIAGISRIVEAPIMSSQGLYSCNLCGKAFDAVCHLETHVRSHTGERPYSCNQCDKSFTVMSNLRRHMKTIHSKERSFVCEACGKTFSQSNNLKRHRKTHGLTDEVEEDRSRSSSGGSQSTEDSSLNMGGGGSITDQDQEFSVCDTGSRRLSAAEHFESMFGAEFSEWCTVELQMFVQGGLDSPQSINEDEVNVTLHDSGEFKTLETFELMPELPLATEAFPCLLKRNSSLEFDAETRQRIMYSAELDSTLPPVSGRLTPDGLYLSRRGSDKENNGGTHETY